MEHGIVNDWNDMELVWGYLYGKGQLQTDKEEHPVLLTEAPLNPTKNREKMAEIFFETFNVPALFVSMQAVLSLYSTGKLHTEEQLASFWIAATALLTQSRFSKVLQCRTALCVSTLLLRKEGFDFHKSSEFELVRQIKEKLCYLSTNPLRDENTEIEKIQYTLPDGSRIDLGQCRFRAAECLFRPDLIGEEAEGVHECLVYSIQKSDLELRKVLYQNIVLSGGSTLFQGFGDRLLNETKKLAPKDVKIRISAPQERRHSTWIGGSILASLDTFRKMWVSKKEYEDEGAKVINRKTF
uniref:Uncharacterized protein n=1 Tax=Romanomermis culicivorax TaxID=13658 RepID=A0A915IW72_ROMCU